jgi:hypothetical protein
MKYNNAESYEALVKRGIICEIMRRVALAYDEDGRVAREVEGLPELNKGKMRLLREITAYDFA